MIYRIYSLCKSIDYSAGTMAPIDIPLRMSALYVVAAFLGMQCFDIPLQDYTILKPPSTGITETNSECVFSTINDSIHYIVPLFVKGLLLYRRE